MSTTETFLLPGQQSFTVKPWEIANLPRASTAGKPPSPPKGNALDDDEGGPEDPCAGGEVGPCEIIRRLSPGSVKNLLALRHDAREGATLVQMRRLDLPDGLAAEIKTHAEGAWKFKHPHVSRVFPCEASDEGIFWVSERTSGATLAELGEACRKLGKGLPVGLVLGAVYEAAQALGELHVPSGFAHGLISDQAVAIGFDGVAKLQDVGLFKCVASPQRREAISEGRAIDGARSNPWTEALDVVGPYLSPEQLLQGRMPDPKSDCFSLGAVLWEGLTGQRLPRAATFDERVKKQAHATFQPPSTFNVSLTKELDAVLARALTADRAQRYFDSLEFADALRKAAASFMWRPELRADFVGNLFPTRKKREQALLARCTPKRSLTRPELQMPVVVAPKPPALPPLQVLAVPLAAKPRPAAAAKALPKKAPRPKARHLRVLSLALTAAALAWVAWSGVLPAEDLSLLFAEPPPAPWPVVVAPAPVPLPVVAVPAEPLVCEAPADAPAAPVVAAPEAPKPVAKKVLKRKKKADEDVPLPPWLQPSRKGRR